MTPGKYLRTTRKRLGLTLKTVAASYGCSIPYLSDIERGNRKIPSSDIDREFLVRAYGIEERELDAHIFRADGVLKATDLTADEREEVLAFVAQLGSERT
jgi:transcriptional regulator with XRE-family HTH domain